MSSDPSDGAAGAPDLPLYLMPLAFGLLVYAGTSLLRVLHLVYLNNIAAPKAAAKRGGSRSTTPVPNAFPSLQSSEFFTILLSGFLAWIAYSYCVAQVEAATVRALRASYNPYALLGVSMQESNTTVLKEAFRTASQLHHPDTAGGDAQVFAEIYTAYLLLTEQASPQESNNYQRYGHPEGMLTNTPALVFDFPAWLTVAPPASIQLVMRVVQVLCLLAALAYLVQAHRAARKVPERKTSTTAPAKDLLSATQSVAAEDMAYLTKTLQPDTKVLDILYAILSTPENIAWALQDLDRVEKIRKTRLEDDAKEEATPANKKDGFDALFDSDEGWADDEDDETEASQKAKAAEAARKAEMEGLKKATGKTKPMLEGIDQGVLGQGWVEKTLQKAGQWPPALGILQDQTFDYEGKQVGPLEHPGLKRVLCMTVGRLNSNMLNAHPQLIQAGMEKKIDQTYFGASMEFRQRVGMLLEAALRIAMGLQCHSLVSTIVESVAIFKVGCQPGQESIDRFNALMQRQYLCLPRLAVNYKELKVHVKQEKTAGPPPEETKEMADARKGTTVVEDLPAGETAEFGLDLDRVFAENLFRQKSAALQKQGIPPQVALQSYREGWWVLLRYERLDGETVLEPLKPPANMVKALSLDDKTMSVFAQARPRLATGWPVLIPNIKQKILKIKIQFKAPKVPGKYRVFVSIKSQDFLGADQEVYLDTQVVEATNKKDE